MVDSRIFLVIIQLYANLCLYRITLKCRCGDYSVTVPPAVGLPGCSFPNLSNSSGVGSVSLARILLRAGYIKQIFQPNYKKLGFKKGLFHVYIKTGNIKGVAEDLSLSSDGIMSAGVHISNSDIVGEFVYEDSEQLVDLISHVKEMDEVDRVVWSKEVFLLRGKKHSIVAVLDRIIDREIR